MQTDSQSREEIIKREATIYRMVVGALAIALITFGVLNLADVI